jgi:hypothetical protein
MPRFSFVGFFLIALAALSLPACAKNASDTTDDEGAAAATSPQADPDAGNNNYTSYDAGTEDGRTSQDSGAEPQDSGSSQPQDSGTAQLQDSGSTQPQDSGGGWVTPACDISNPVMIAIYEYKLTQINNPQQCPCNTGECCYLLVCVPQ